MRIKKGDKVKMPDVVTIQLIDEEAQTATVSWQEEKIVNDVKKTREIVCESVPLKELQKITRH